MTDARAEITDELDLVDIVQQKLFDTQIFRAQFRVTATGELVNAPLWFFRDQAKAVVKAILPRLNESHAAELATHKDTTRMIEEMSDNEGILSIKGHGSGPEVHLTYWWDRFGPGAAGYGNNLHEAIVQLYGVFSENKRRVEEGTFECQDISKLPWSVPQERFERVQAEHAAELAQRDAEIAELKASRERLRNAYGALDRLCNANPDYVPVAEYEEALRAWKFIFDVLQPSDLSDEVSQ